MPSASTGALEPPTQSFFVSFDDDPETASPADKARLDRIVHALGPSGGHVELTGSSISSGDLTIDRSKALRRGEALRNWFIAQKISGAKVVVKNPGAPCVPPSGKTANDACRGVQVDAWWLVIDLDR